MFIGVTQIVFAQTHPLEIKISPLRLIFGAFSPSVEYGYTDKIGFDVEPSFVNFSTKITINGNTNPLSAKGVGIQLAAKYYINPSKGLDKFSIGPYLSANSSTGESIDAKSNPYKFKVNNVGLGVYFSYKWVKKSGLLFELALGGGANLIKNAKLLSGSILQSDIPTSNFSTAARIGIGYRFQVNEKK